MIRRAGLKDIEGLKRLLLQVNNVHNAGRPDIFIRDCMKYNDEELKELLKDENKPIFVSVDENDYMLGYAFCVVEDHQGSNNLTDIKTLYIDDLCVDEQSRGQHIGKSLFEYVKKYAKDTGFYNLTLNVWALNENAHSFYDAMGMKILKYGMETIL